MLADQAADSEFSEELETPSSDEEVVSVASIGIVEIEDRLDGLGRFGCSPARFGYVCPFVGEGGEKFDALASKGRRIALL